MYVVIPPLGLSSGLKSSVTWERDTFSTALRSTSAYCGMCSWTSCRKSLMTTNNFGTTTPSDLFVSLVVHLANQKPCTTSLTGLYLTRVMWPCSVNIRLHFHSCKFKDVWLEWNSYIKQHKLHSTPNLHCHCTKQKDGFISFNTKRCLVVVANMTVFD